MSSETEIHPFRLDMPGEAIADLRRRIAATRWPTRELVADRSQGVQLATIQELARYWATEYDWRACEGKLNALPQFTTQIDGVDIHFIHVRSPHAGALPQVGQVFAGHVDLERADGQASCRGHGASAAGFVAPLLGGAGGDVVGMGGRLVMTLTCLPFLSITRLGED